MNRGFPSKKHMIEVVQQFSGRGVLVIGDLMLDKFIWGRADRISAEAPIPVVEAQSETYAAGGAANVITNLHALGAKVFSAGIVGIDPEGSVLTDILSERGLTSDGLISVEDRPTTLKTRIIAHSQQLVRVDREQKEPIGPEVVEKILAYVKSRVSKVQAVVISDYAKGVVTHPLVEGVVDICQRRRSGRIPILVDPKVLDFTVYRGVDVVKPNKAEAAQAAHIIIRNEEDLQLAAEKLLRDAECQAVLISRSEEGMSLFEKARGFLHVPIMGRKVYDVTGAGDTVMAALALCMAVGSDLPTAAHISNYAAGVVVGKVGVSTVSKEELESAITRGV